MVDPVVIFTVAGAVAALISGFKDGASMFRKWRARRGAKRRFQGEQLDDILEHSLREIRTKYDHNHKRFGRRFAAGDAISRLALIDILVTMNEKLLDVLKNIVQNTSSVQFDLSSLKAIGYSTRKDGSNVLNQLAQRLLVALPIQPQLSTQPRLLPLCMSPMDPIDPSDYLPPSSWAPEPSFQKSLVPISSSRIESYKYEVDLARSPPNEVYERFSETKLTPSQQSSLQSPVLPSYTAAGNSSVAELKMRLKSLGQRTILQPTVTDMASKHQEARLPIRHQQHELDSNAIFEADSINITDRSWRPTALAHLEHEMGDLSQQYDEESHLSNSLRSMGLSYPKQCPVPFSPAHSSVLDESPAKESYYRPPLDQARSYERPHNSLVFERSTLPEKTENEESHNARAGRWNQNTNQATQAIKAAITQTSGSVKSSSLVFCPAGARLSSTGPGFPWHSAFEFTPQSPYFVCRICQSRIPKEPFFLIGSDKNGGTTFKFRVSAKFLARCHKSRSNLIGRDLPTPPPPAAGTVVFGCPLSSTHSTQHQSLSFGSRNELWQHLETHSTRELEEDPDLLRV